MASAKTPTQLYADAEEKIIADMARRISEYDYFIPAAQHQLRAMEAMGACRDAIFKRLSAATKKSDKELAAMLKQAVDDDLAIDKAIYLSNGLNPETAMHSAAIAAQMQAGYRQTNGTLKNITKTTAKNGAIQFQRELDKAWLMVSSGAFSQEEAVQSVVKDLADAGVDSVKYDSGRVLSLGAAVGMCVRTGVSQTVAHTREALADELDCDLVEVTAHAGARPDHAEWQGKIYSRSGKSRKYPSLVESTGYGTVTGLCGANCRHSFWPYFEGTARTWTPEQLAEMERPKFEYNGKKLTEYEATQAQRNIERHIRRYKRELVGLEAAGQDSNAAAVKLRHWQERESDFLAQTGFKRQSAREQVTGFGRSEAAKAGSSATAAAKAKAAAEAEKAKRAAERAAAKKAKQELAERHTKEYNKKQEEIRELIRSEETPKNINRGNQNKHIRNSGSYISGRSYIYGDLETAQSLVNRYSGTGEAKFNNAGEWTHKEFVTGNNIIGVTINPRTGEAKETKRFSIHYGKHGTHVVPADEVVKQ